MKTCIETSHSWETVIDSDLKTAQNIMFNSLQIKKKLHYNTTDTIHKPF